jgi:hypothetical protein
MNKKLAKPGLMIVVCLQLGSIVFINGHSRLLNESQASQFETRCGWLDIPTPANVWLFDRDGKWIIGMQGGYQMEGDEWELPDFRPRQWVRTNVGDYGYGCACLRLRVNRETHEVIEIKSSRARPLLACRRDRSLRRWGLR